MHCSRRSFIGGASALLFADCLASEDALAGNPGLRLGVLGDLHITDEASTAAFRKALAYFRDRDVDVVVVTGDLTDHGILPELENVARAWYDVFPEDTGFGGKKVERVFIYGNHDCEGLSYRDEQTDKALSALGLSYKEAVNLSIASLGFAECWEKCFHESYAPIYVKNVKGSDFIAAHWDYSTCDRQGVFALQGWMKGNIGSIDTDQPFFFIQHQAPGGTIFGTDAWGDDSGIATRCFREYPNAVVFSGHSHLPLTDGRNYWRGEFTSIGTSSLSYVCFPEGRENQSDYRLAPGCRQGQLVNVFEDRVVIERRDFTHDEPLAADISFTFPVEASPFKLRAEAKHNIPAFAEGASAYAIQDKKAVEVSFPGAFANPTVTPFQYRVSLECVLKDCTKQSIESDWFQADVCFSRERAEKGFNFASVPLEKIPAGTVQILVRITPYNSYGGAGEAIVSNFIQFKEK